MKRMTLLLMLVSATTFAAPKATVYTCGALKFNGRSMAGIPENVMRFSVILQGGKVYLAESSTSRKEVREEAVLEKQHVEMATYTTKDMRISFGPPIHGQSIVGIEMLTNSEWATSCTK